MQAAYWYLHAADHGLANAQFNVGVVNARGKAISNDCVQA
jgi:TPR repeat protein